MKKTLSIGRVTHDQYIRDGEVVEQFPGGSAYNIARWFDDAGFDSALAATLGSDFQPASDIDTEKCVRIDKRTFTVRIHLSDKNGDEERDEIGYGYEPRSLETPTTRYDLVGLFSVEEPLLELFESAKGRIKVYDPGEMLDDYQWPLLRRAFEEADHVFMNQDETEATEALAPCPVSQLVTEYDLTTLVVTSRSSITVHDGEDEHSFSVEVNEEPTDTVGAGDAFTSRYLEGTLRGEVIGERTKAARERASKAVERVGSLPSRFWKETTSDRPVVGSQK